MGLDTTHDCWHGAYSAFMRWRHKLAEVAGYDILPVKYNDGYTMETVMLDWGHLSNHETLMGKWDKTPDDPLLVLIVHSDCEGAIYPEQAGLLADRLDELVSLLPDDDDGGHIGNWRQKTRTFIAGLRTAFANHEAVEFH